MIIPPSLPPSLPLSLYQPLAPPLPPVLPKALSRARSKSTARICCLPIPRKTPSPLSQSQTRLFQLRLAAAARRRSCQCPRSRLPARPAQIFTRGPTRDSPAGCASTCTFALLPVHAEAGNAPGARGAGKWRPGRPGAAWTARADGCCLDGPSRQWRPGRPGGPGCGPGREPTGGAGCGLTGPGTRPVQTRPVQQRMLVVLVTAVTAGARMRPLVRATDAATRRLVRVFTAGECQCHSVLNRRRREGRWMESAD